MDTVFWDMWENGNSNYFDEFIVPSGNDAGKLSAVDLLIPGIYLIFVRIDWDDFFEGQVRIGTNYDDSYVITKEHGDTAFSFYGPDGDTQMRYLGIDQTSAQNFVEIAVGHNDPTAADHTIPGNSEGAWAQYPELVITYLCDPGLTGFPFSS